MLRDAAASATAAAAPAGTYDVRGSDEDTRALLDPIRRITGKVLHGFDDVLGRFIGTQLGRVNQAVRERIANPAAATLGDVICYQGNAARIQQRLFDVIDQKAPGWGAQAQPISVIAHSLGGVVAFDTAVRSAVPGRQLHISRLVTFGSQAAFFHIIDPRVPALEPYRHKAPVVLPLGSILSWTNLWDPLDPLAFTAGTVFRLHGGIQPEDIPVQGSATELFEAKLFPHSVYWASEELRRVLAQFG
ncbi:MAG: hypothetical protein HC793_04260 [Aquincola sp.]|nr:hypothetical protein [Aquincola sp.]